MTINAAIKEPSFEGIISHILKNKSIKTGVIHQESCITTMRKMPSECIDLVITSPPYDDMRSYEGDKLTEFDKIAQSLYRVVKDGGVVVWVVGDQTIKGNETGSSFKQALRFKEVGFNLFDTMIYAKPPRGAVGNNKTYWQTFEYMFVLSKGQPKTINLICDRENKDSRKGDNGTKRLHNGELKQLKRGGYAKKGRRTNIWQYHIGKGHSSSDAIAHQHPAIFPEKLARDHIKSWSKKNDVVYDPFMGSGTTAKMAELEERKWIGSEISKKYCKISAERLKFCGYDQQPKP